MKPIIFALLIAVSIAGPAEARHVKRQADPPTLVERLAGAVASFVRRAASAAATTAASAATARVEAPGRPREAFYAASDLDGEVVAHPVGCPRIKFCACGVTVRKYGHPVPSLFAASSWRQFPRAECGAGRVAIWGSIHVALILSCHADGTADLYDANSGGGLTRIHRRELPSLIVDPPASL